MFRQRGSSQDYGGVSSKRSNAAVSESSLFAQITTDAIANSVSKALHTLDFVCVKSLETWKGKTVDFLSAFPRFTSLKSLILLHFPISFQSSA